MARTKKEVIIDGLSGRPINDLFTGWTFIIKEIAPYVFRVDAEDMHGQTIFGVGGSAEDALDDCIRRVERKITVRGFWEEVARKVRELLGLGK